MWPPSQRAIFPLVQALKDNAVHDVAAEAFSQIGRPAVPALIRSLKESDEDVREAAIEALDRIGPRAKDAVVHLVRILKDRNKNVRELAKWALAQIDKSSTLELRKEFTSVRYTGDFAQSLL